MIEVESPPQLTEIRRQLLSMPPPPPGFAGAFALTEAIKAMINSIGGDDIKTIHNFTPGIYHRSIKIPKGSILVSKIHTTTHPFVLHSGDVSVWTSESGWIRMTAPYVGVTTPWTVRIFYAHEDSVWSTFHATKETCVDKIESQIILNPKELWHMLQQH